MPPPTEGVPGAPPVHNASTPFVEPQHRTGRSQISAQLGSPMDETRSHSSLSRDAADANQDVRRPTRQCR
jgi:hypothetical protein